MTKVISVDIGYCNVKTVFNEWGSLRQEKFPTAIAPIPLSDHYDDLYKKDEHFYFEDQFYTVGEAAKTDSVNTTICTDICH